MDTFINRIRSRCKKKILKSLKEKGEKLGEHEIEMMIDTEVEKIADMILKDYESKNLT